MSTSEWGYLIRNDTSTWGDADDALDALTTRMLVNNLNHMADEYGQVRVCMSGIEPSYSGKSGYLESRTPTYSDTLYAVTSWSFPVSQRASGYSYRIRVRIAGASGDGVADAWFFAVLSPGRLAPSFAVTLSDAIYQTDVTTSSTPAWLTGASKGAEAFATMMEMDPSQMAACMTEFPTTLGVGGDACSVSVPWVTLSIFAATSDPVATPRLYAVYAAEVIGT